MRTSVSWVLSRVLMVVGLALLGVATYAHHRMVVQRLDKAAYFVFGRWFDAYRHVQLPLLAVGGLLLVAGVVLWLRGDNDGHDLSAEPIAR